jgi:glycosyltransferase involved in cell wall biosynthesis
MAASIELGETRFAGCLTRWKGALRMRIVMVTAFPEDPGRIASGLSGVSVTLAHALAAIPDLHLEIIVPGASSNGERHATFGDVTVHYLPRGSVPGAALRYVWTSPREIARKLAAIEHDLVHVQNWANFLPRSRKPAVLTIHGILERDILYRGRLRWLRSQVMKGVEMRARERAAHVIVVSPYVREALEGHLRGRTWEIDNPVAERFFTVDRRPVAGRVLFAGRLTALKNVTGLIEGFALLARNDARAELRVAGGDDGSGYAEECARLAAKLGVGERVAFLNHTRSETLAEELSRASCLALCSFQENAPLVIAEAMAAGVPVVASRVGGIPSMVEEGRTGCLIDPQEPEQIADALAGVMEPGAGGRMSSTARQTALERFRPSVVAAKTVAVYREILGRANR